MPRRKTSGLMALGLIALFAAAFGVRLIHLGKADLWQDEVLLVQTANPDMTPGEVWGRYMNIAVSMAWLPLPAVLQNVYLRAAEAVTGSRLDSAFAQRLPGVLLGALAVPVLVLMGVVLGDRRLGWAAGIWALFNFYFIFYAREVHAYPMLMMLSSLHWVFLARLWQGPVERRRWYPAFGLVQVCLALTHLTATLMMAVSAAVTLALFIASHLKREAAGRKHFLLVGLAQGAGLLAVSPYYVAILTKDNPHLDMGATISMAGMLYDVVGKTMYGEHLVPAGVGFVLLLAGAVYVAGRVEQRKVSRWILLAAMGSFIAIALAAGKTQYLSARYFMSMVPVFALCAAAGFLWAGTQLQRILKLRERGVAVIFSVLMLAVITPQVVVFLPPYFNLTAKSVDFGAIADWINENLAPGTPYLMESAYELRFVGSYYPTPGKIGASPYVHGGAPGELQRLHERQIAFMEQFPEAPFIESAHHGAGTPEGIWSWPRENFRRHVRLPNDPLRHLIRMGIYPGEPGVNLKETDFHIDIYYNTREDRLAAARERGDAVVFDYPGWQVGGNPIAPNATEYFRVAPAARSEVNLTRLTDAPLRGALASTIAVISDAPSETVTLQIAGQAPVSFTLGPGQFTHVPLREVNVIEPETALEIRHRGASVKALLLRQLQFSN